MTMTGSDPQVPNLPTGVTINVPAAPAPPPPPPQPGGDFVSRQEALAWVERTRQEEKDKLYGTVNDLKTQVDALNAERQAQLEEQQARQQAAEEEARRLADAELSAKELIEQTSADFERKLADIREERDRERIVRQKEAEFHALQEYRLERLRAEADEIYPDLAEFVQGSTKEQIDASIALAKTKTAKIIADTREAMQQQMGGPPSIQYQPFAAQPQGQPQGQQQGWTPPPSGLPTSGQPPIDVLGQQTDGQRTLSVEDLRSMSMEDYAANREAILRGGSQRVATQGPYAP